MTYFSWRQYRGCAVACTAYFIRLMAYFPLWFTKLRPNLDQTNKTMSRSSVNHKEKHAASRMSMPIWDCAISVICQRQPVLIIAYLLYKKKRRMVGPIFRDVKAPLIIGPLIILWGNYLKLVNDASVASACFFVRTCRRVRSDSHLPG